MSSVFWRLCWISFFADISSEFLYPILPLFLTATLGASMSAVGLIEGCADLTASLLKAQMGRWSDQVSRRRPFVMAGYFFSTFGKVTIGLATTWTWVLSARILDRVGKGIRTAPRDALIAESVPPEKLGTAFGIHRLMDTAGAVLGPLIAVGLLSLGFTDLRQYFLWALIPGLIAIALTFWIREVPRSSSSEFQASAKTIPGLRELPMGYKKFVGIWGLFALTNSSDAFILLRMQSVGIELIPMILIYCGFNLVYALGSGIFGKWSDRVGQRTALLVSLLVFAFCYAGFAFATTIPEFIFYYAVYGVHMAMSEGVSKALVSTLVPREQLGTAQGYFGMVQGICLFFASVAAGVLWQEVSPAAPFLFGALGAGVTFVFMSWNKFGRP